MTCSRMKSRVACGLLIILAVNMVFLLSLNIREYLRGDEEKLRTPEDLMETSLQPAPGFLSEGGERMLLPHEDSLRIHPT